MVILVDTNILMDVIADRKPYAEYGKEYWKCVQKDKSQELWRHTV